MKVNHLVITDGADFNRVLHDELYYDFFTAETYALLFLRTWRDKNPDYEEGQIHGQAIEWEIKVREVIMTVTIV